MTGDELIEKYKALLEEAQGTKVTSEQWETLSNLGHIVQVIEEEEEQAATA